MFGGEVVQIPAKSFDDFLAGLKRDAAGNVDIEDLKKPPLVRSKRQRMLDVVGAHATTLRLPCNRATARKKGSSGVQR